MSIIWKGDHSPRHVHVFRDGRLDLLLHQLTVEAVRRAEERKTVDRILELLQVLDAEELRVE